MRLHTGMVSTRSRGIQSGVGALASGYTVSRLHTPSTATSALLNTLGTSYMEYPQGVARYNQGALVVEEQRTNGNRNVRADGASTVIGAGGGGTPIATNWTMMNRLSGLSLDVSPVTYLGMTGLRMRFYGTTTAAPGAETLEFEARQLIPAASGQVWTSSYRYRLVAGTFPVGANLSTRILTYDGAATPAIVDNNSGLATPVDGTLRRVSFSLTAGLNVATIVSGCHIYNFPASTPCDFTIDIFYPQIEQGTAPSSSILPAVGTPSATTRNADQITRSIAPTKYNSRNSLINSEAFSTWQLGNSTVNTASTVGPYTGTNGDGVVSTAISGFHHVSQNVGLVAVPGRRYTVSVYAKAGTTNFLRYTLPLEHVSGTSVVYSFNLTTGAATQDFGASANVIATATATSIGGGWWRCSVTYVAQTTGPSTSKAYMGYAPATGTTSWLGDATEGIYLWGAQFTESSGVPAYTKTTASQAASHSKGTLVASARLVGALPTSGFASLLSIYDDVPNTLAFYYNSAGTLQAIMSAIGVTIVDTGGSFTAPITLGQFFKIGVTWDTTTGYLGIQCMVNGTVTGTLFGNVDLMPVFNNLGIGYSPVVVSAGLQEYRRTSLFDRPVSSAEMTQLLLAA